MDKKIVLVINAHPLGKNPTSFSNITRTHFLEEYKKLYNPKKEEIKEITLSEEDVPSLGNGLLEAWGKLSEGKRLNEGENKIVAHQQAILSEFMSAGKYVVSYPLYNLMIPSKMKDYIDNILIARKTFHYTSHGAEGLLTDGRSVVLIQGSGSVYTNDDGYGALEHGQKYLQSIFAFMGITDLKTVRAQGTAYLPKEAVLAKAYEEADRAANFLVGK